MSELRCQKTSRPATRPALDFPDLRSPISNLSNRRRHSPCRCSRIGIHAFADARASAKRIPMPRPDLPPGWPGLLHGHDSLHDFIRSQGPSSADRPDGRARSPSQLTGPNARRRPRDFRPLFSAIRAHPRLVVGLGRFERPTSRLSGVRSDPTELQARSEGRDQRAEIRSRARQPMPSATF
jgi:hypothetical protein